MPGIDPIITPPGEPPPDPVPPATPHIVAAETISVSGVVAVQLSYS